MAWALKLATLRDDPLRHPRAGVVRTMRVFLAGGTGLIGRGVVKRLLERDDSPVVLSRSAERAREIFAGKPVDVIQGDPMTPGAWQEALGGCDAVVNLAGESLFAQRWSPGVKRLIRDSRVHSTGNLVAAIARAAKRPAVLVQGSAIGYYGPHGDEEITEASPPGTDFMADVCRDWEAAAQPAAELGLRVPIVRTGLVLARGEGALGVMTPVFRRIPGGAAPVGNGGSPIAPATGRQWMSWIHVDDIVGLFILALDAREAAGPLNGTAPNPVRNVEFSRELARVLRRDFPFTPWVFLPLGLPDPALKLVLGEVADVVVKGQKVLPTEAERLGYRFQYPELTGALAQLFARTPRAAETAAVARAS
jgi:uncharacterized protein (TIGR01777 family)